jgi:uncharacterized protein YndB with AHSA1/START domain
MTAASTDRLGTLERAGDTWQVRFTRLLPQSPERVWRALTDPEELGAWFPTTIEGERRSGARLVFTFPEGQAPPFEGLLTVWDPPQVLELLWGAERLRFELAATETGTELTLRHTIEELGTGARTAAGWHVCLDALERTLRGDAGPAAVTWADVHPLYVQSFGPAAATIGPPQGFE